jgi:hypothetical protein
VLYVRNVLVFPLHKRAGIYRHHAVAVSVENLLDYFKITAHIRPEDAEGQTLRSKGEGWGWRPSSTIAYHIFIVAEVVNDCEREGNGLREDQLHPW